MLLQAYNLTINKITRNLNKNNMNNNKKNKIKRIKIITWIKEQEAQTL